jgi:hypothetical protein
MTEALRLLVAPLLVAFSIAGCSAQITGPPNSPSPSSRAPVWTPVELGREFRFFADASCQKANEIGATETIIGSSARLVLVPEGLAYNGFTAAVVTNEGGETPIWSAEDFAVCVDSVNYSTAEESGSTYEILVTGDLESGVFRSEDIVQDLGLFVTDYIVRDGLIITTYSQSTDSNARTDIKYGRPSDQDLQYFREAIDLFLSSG